MVNGADDLMGNKYSSQDRYLEKIDRVHEYFSDLYELRLVPEPYQSRIIYFFLENRHYNIDVSDIWRVLRGAKKCIVYRKIDELLSFVRKNEISGVIACNRHFDSTSEYDEWMEELSLVCDLVSNAELDNIIPDSDDWMEIIQAINEAEKNNGGYFQRIRDEEVTVLPLIHSMNGFLEDAPEEWYLVALQ